jgi:protein regulator of cytokinesis 1
LPQNTAHASSSQLFSALSETLHNQLNIVAKEKHELTEKAQSLIKTIRQMERSLDDSRPQSEFEQEDDGLQITFPLITCIQRLKEKHHAISKLHRERFEQVKKLVEALQSYASHLEPSFVKIKLPPTAPNAEIPPSFDLSPTYVGKLDGEFTRVYEEYNRRITAVSQYADEIINLWSELGVPQAQVDSQIVQHAREAPEQLGLHQDDLKRLVSKRDKLVAEKQQRERKLKDLRSTVDGLWERLGVDESERKQFLAANRGCGLRQINEFEDELSRLNELKRQNLHIFVEDARFKLQALWDDLYYSEEEMLDFTPAFSDVYSDALLSAHEQEISRLETLKEQRAPILAVIDKHRSIINDRQELEKSSQDASRLTSKGQKGEKRDPGKLLREEKMRKRITKELPKVEAELRKTLEAWEDEYGRPFCVHGERYLDELEAAAVVKAPPPRSKTPSALQPAREAPKSVGRSGAPASRAGTVRGPPPPRSKTPTMVRSGATSSMAGSHLARSNVPVSSAKVSPSKIPGASRLPMSALRDGNNSPERRQHPARSQTAIGHRPDDMNGTIRMPPPRAPPPKMKDLFPDTPTPMTGHHPNNKENGSDPDRNISMVRHVDSDDPYTHSHNSYLHSSISQHQNHNQHQHPQPQPPRHHPHDSHHPHYPPPPRSYDSYSTTSTRPPSNTNNNNTNNSRQDYPVAPPSRQTSTTSSLLSGGTAGSSITGGSGYGGASSTTGTTVSGGGGGSENWESYTDNSELDDGDDGDAAYYAHVQSQQQRSTLSKRPATANGMHLGAVKRVREHALAEPDGPAGRGMMMMGSRVGSDVAWSTEDEGVVGETY